jgi:hypothetical protein
MRNTDVINLIVCETTRELLRDCEHAMVREYESEQQSEHRYALRRHLRHLWLLIDRGIEELRG